MAGRSERVLTSVTKLPPRRTKQPLNSFEALVIALVMEGLRSRYDLTVRAGMSVGSTAPALKRLEKAGYLKSTLGPRRRQSYEVTSRGVAALKETLTGGLDTFWWETGLAGVESIPRTVLLLWIYSDSQVVREFLNFATQDLAAEAEKRERDVASLEIEMKRLDRLLAGKAARKTIESRQQLFAILNKALKAKADAVFLKAQSGAMAQLFEIVPHLPRSLQFTED